MHSDWWAWEQTGRVRDRSELACDHYRRFPQDFDLAAELGHRAHRFSIEWSRVEPAQDRWDDGALAHYVEVVRALRERRLEPIVTLHHFTSPQWLTASGGWANPDVVPRFARYVERVARALGDQVRYWITINEPMVFVRMHYVQGLGPPGARDLRLALKVIEHLIRAHAAGYQILHAAARRGGTPPAVSIAHHVPAFWPCRRWFPLDRWMAFVTDRLFNVALLDALTDGRWQVPGIGRWVIPEARATLDFLGINFYGRQFLRWSPLPRGWLKGSCDLGHHPREVTERTSFGWDVHPASFHRVLVEAKRFRRPILVTENGTWMADDARRWRYIAGHLAAMARAMQDGSPVVGYCYWSLLDNFEWADGYAPRFGLIAVDYATQQRTIRESARRYAEVCRTHRLVLGASELQRQV